MKKNGLLETLLSQLKKKLSQEEKKLLKAKKKEEKAEKEEKAARKRKQKKTAKEAEMAMDAVLLEKVEEPEEQDISNKEIKGMTVEEATLVFRALADETRMEILSILEEGELYALELLQRVKVVQSTLSHHMKVLTESGLVCCRKDNKRSYYSICKKKMEEAAEFLLHYK